MPIGINRTTCLQQHELRNLFPDDPLATKLKEQTFLLSEFLGKKAANYALPQLRRKALVHGHCHQKSVLGFESEQSLLKKMAIEVEAPPVGCCGMAGSFGFEPEKYEVSVAIGEHGLLPEVRRSDPSTIIVADGFSCREQFAQQTERRALHLAEVIEMARSGRAQETEGPHPETAIYTLREKKTRKARRRAAFALISIALGSFFVARYVSKRI